MAGGRAGRRARRPGAPLLLRAAPRCGPELRRGLALARIFDVRLCGGDHSHGGRQHARGLRGPRSQRGAAQTLERGARKAGARAHRGARGGESQPPRRGCLAGRGGGSDPATAENGSCGTAHGRHRARLQQHARDRGRLARHRQTLSDQRSAKSRALHRQRNGGRAARRAAHLAPARLLPPAVPRPAPARHQ